MRLLPHIELPEVPLERVIRHGAAGGFVLLLVVAAPAVLVAAFFGRLASNFASLPWVFWIVGGPLMLVAFLVWLLVLQAVRSSAQAALLPTNWVLRVSAAGIGVHLRSFRNAHFRKDVPTVLWLDPGEVVRARRVRESCWIANARGRQLVRRSWLELELEGVDTAALEKRLDEERRDQGPEIRVLGIRTHARFNDTPVFVARPGVLRVEFLGQAMLEALREQVEIAPEQKIDLDSALGSELEPRVRALCVRGMEMAARELVRRERGLSWTEAKEYVEGLGRKAA
jgi:hypothetical protein